MKIGAGGPSYSAVLSGWAVQHASMVFRILFHSVHAIVDLDNLSEIMAFVLLALYI
jgi:hypothetical protein